jgi:predicted amidophosphoribosyltransferase
MKPYKGAIFILTIVRITHRRGKLNLPNKRCCRGCGATLSPVSECPTCKENISWICSRCDTMADVTHIHYRFEIHHPLQEQSNHEILGI